MANELQNEILNIYKEIKKICDKHNIRHYAIGGTCIGAIRHKGFIPWDDDLDIAMPAVDYKKFWEVAPKELPDNLKLIKLDNIKNNPNIFSKVHNVNTTFVERIDVDYPEYYKGVFVDIMPMYGVPSGKKEQKRYAFKSKLLYRLNAKQKLAFKHIITLKGKIMKLLLLPINIFVSKNYWSKRRVDFISKYDFDNCDFTGYTWSISIGSLIFPKSWFEDFVEVPFEDTTIRCPKEWNLYLTAQFGDDYMTIPPESKRITHGIEIADLERPFSYYQNKK